MRKGKVKTTGKTKRKVEPKRTAWKSTAKQKMKDLFLIPTVRLEDRQNKAMWDFGSPL